MCFQPLTSRCLPHHRFLLCSSLRRGDEDLKGQRQRTEHPLDKALALRHEAQNRRSSSKLSG